MLIELPVPVGTLGLVEGRSLPEETGLRFERTATAVDCRSFSLVVSGDDVEAVVVALRKSRAVEDVTLVAEPEEGVVYRQTWVDSLPGILESVSGSAGTVLSAVAVGDAWTFELRSPNHDAASRFYAAYAVGKFPITIPRVEPGETTRGASRATLTLEQREALHRAFEAGYFDIPRRVTTAELADGMDISDTALLQRLRRGLSTVLRESVELSPDVD